MKNLQFLSNFYETWSKWQSHQVVRLPKYQVDTTKIVDFSLLKTFWASLIFYLSVFTSIFQRLTWGKNTVFLSKNHLKWNEMVLATMYFYHTTVFISLEYNLELIVFEKNLVKKLNFFLQFPLISLSCIFSCMCNKK